MAGGTVSRTPHFVLHRAPIAPSAPPGPASQERRQVLFPIGDEPWIGAVVPKRWARRAVTRNAIRRQIYSVSEAFAARLPAAAHVVRLRMEFARAQFPSASSEALKAAVRGELEQLFERAPRLIPAQAGTQGEAVLPAPSPVLPAQAGTQERPR